MTINNVCQLTSNTQTAAYTDRREERYTIYRETETYSGERVAPTHMYEDTYKHTYTSICVQSNRDILYVLTY